MAEQCLFYRNPKEWLAIAERLKLSVNTVKNHKKRMYLKLDITTERELFLTFVNFLITGRVGDGPYGVHWQGSRKAGS